MGKLGGQGGNPIDRNREASRRFSPDWPTGLGKTTTPRHRLRSLPPQRHPPADRSRYHRRRVLPIVDAIPSPKRNSTPLLRRSAKKFRKFTPPPRPLLLLDLRRPTPIFRVGEACGSRLSIRFLIRGEPVRLRPQRQLLPLGIDQGAIGAKVVGPLLPLADCRGGYGRRQAAEWTIWGK